MANLKNTKGAKTKSPEATNEVLTETAPDVTESEVTVTAPPEITVAPTDIEDSIVVHSDNLDDNGFLYAKFSSRNPVYKRVRIEGAEALDIVLTAGFAGTLYVFSGDPNDPNSPAYSRDTSEADFAITKPYGKHEENTYHFRIKGEYATFYFSSTFNTDYILVKAENFERALSVLSAEGYTIA